MTYKLNFKKKIVLLAVLIAFVPLLFSYGIFIEDKLAYIDNRIRVNLREAGEILSETPFVQKKLYERKNDMEIQKYAKKFVGVLEDIDIMVVGDMTGEKYSHLYEEQIGEIFIGEDKWKVLKEGVGYYTVTVGSAGETLRWFQPIFYNNKQVGFVMVGKFSKDINVINNKTKVRYFVLLISTFMLVFIAAKLFSEKIKKAMLGMEPDEIAILYKQKSITINSVKEGIIALNKDNSIMEVNRNCYSMFQDFSIDKLIEKLSGYIYNREAFEMKELIIQGRKTFVTLQPIVNQNTYLGVVITLKAKDDIEKIAKEITGVDEVVKNLRANVHEFKNNLHVILGLLQLEEYDEAKKFIYKIQQIQQSNSVKFSSIEDYYVRALLLSRELVAKERNIEFILTEGSFLYSKHNYVSSSDLVTILGNLIENAFEACTMSNNLTNKVEVSLYEDEENIEIEVRDNGKPIDEELKNSIFISGVSSKGEGRGTGLYLVKSRVELYDGEISIEEFNGEKIFVVTILKGEKSHEKHINSRR